MPHLIGLQFHSDGLAVAAMRPDQTIVLRPVHDMASVIQRTCAQRWRWSLGVDGLEPAAVGAARELFVALQHAMGDEHILAGVAVPATWSDRARRALLVAMEGTSVEALRLVRETTALAVGAALIDPSVAGLCAITHVGTHKLELTLAEVSLGTVRVLGRQSVVGLDGSNVSFDSLLGLINEVASFTARQAHVKASEVRRFLCSGRRAADPALANALGGVWGLATEVFPEGTIALGAAHIAVGLTGMYSPWNLLDDLDEQPLANFRGKPPPRSSRTSLRPVPEPERIEVGLMEEIPVVETYRATAPPPEQIDLPSDFVELSTLRSPAPAAPTAPPSGPASSGNWARVSERPSTLPSSGHVAEVGSSGRFHGLPTLASLRVLHLLHPAEAEALLHPALATLLNQFTFLRAASGMLTLQHRSEEVTLPIERGGVCLATTDRARALRAFDWADGTYAWRREKIPWPVQKHRMPMTAFVVGGIRTRLRAFDDSTLAQGHAAKLRLAPAVIDDRRSRLARLALPEAEERAVDHVLDGTRSFETMLGEGYIGRNTMHRLVELLDLYGILNWVKPAAVVGEDPAVEMTRLLNRIEGANHFVALGVHWSAPTDEIRQAWETMQTKYGMGGSWQRHDPTLAARILRRGAAAWGVLRQDSARVQHRREAYPGMDEELLAPLVEARAKALSMRGETSEAERMMLLRGEFHVASDDEPAAKPKR